jgi:hypothetical protein
MSVACVVGNSWVVSCHSDSALVVVCVRDRWATDGAELSLSMTHIRLHLYNAVDYSNRPIEHSHKFKFLNFWHNVHNESQLQSKCPVKSSHLQSLSVTLNTTELQNRIGRCHSLAPLWRPIFEFLNFAGHSSETSKGGWSTYNRYCNSLDVITLIHI